MPPDWWTLYSDPTLDELVGRARESNADLRLAAARCRKPRRCCARRARRCFPRSPASFGARRSRVSTRHPAAAGTAAPLERNDAAPARLDQLRARLLGPLRARRARRRAPTCSASRSSRDVVALTLAGATAQAYFALRSLDAQIAVLDDTIRARRESLEHRARARQTPASPRSSTCTRRRARCPTRWCSGARPSASARCVERQLAQLTGRLDLKLRAGRPLRAAGAADAARRACPRAARAPARHPRRRADAWSPPTRRSASRARRTSRRSRSPARSARRAPSLDDLLASGAGIWSLGLGLVAPLFDAGRREARVDQAEARARAGARRLPDARSRPRSAKCPTRWSTSSETGSTEDGAAARACEAARNALELSTHALRIGLLAVPRSARRAAHRQRRRARLRAQPPGAPRLQRRPDEGARRRLEPTNTTSLLPDASVLRNSAEFWPSR